MKAIDVHVHPPRDPSVPEGKLSKQLRKFQKREDVAPLTPRDFADKYKELDIFGVLFTIDDETVSGETPTSNDWVAQIVNDYPEQFMGFATVDPWKGKIAIKELERSVNELGLKGLKLMPGQQAFFPNDTRFYPLWDKCAELGIPALFHTGQTAVGGGLPGGAGIKLKYMDPICIDDVAADFPDLKIIMAHPGFPWQEVQLSVCLHKANVFIDLSGWAPKYFSPMLVQYAGTLLQDKVMFGSDGLNLLERWLKEFESLPIRDEVRPKILFENAKKLLKLDHLEYG